MSDVVDRNIKTIFEHSKQNLFYINKLETRVDHLESEVLWAKSQMDELRKQIQTLQVRLFSGGPTSGNHN